MDKLFKSIYNNFEGYKNTVANFTGVKDYLFIEDIIQESVTKLVDDLNCGKILISDISLSNGSIKKNYFNTLIIRRTLDHKKKKQFRRVELKEIKYEDDEVINGFDKIDELDFLIHKIDLFSEGCNRNKYHADIFYYLYIHNFSVRKLSEVTLIPRYEITKSHNYLKKIINNWVKNNKMAKAKAVEGVNPETNEKVQFASCAEAGREGFKAVSTAIKSGRLVNGFKFDYVRTITDALNSDEVTGLGDVAAKVIHSKPIKSIASFFGVEIDPDCGNCNERFTKMNKALPLRIRPKRNITQDEYEHLINIETALTKRTANHQTFVDIEQIYAKVFDVRYTHPSRGCGRCYRNSQKRFNLLWKIVKANIDE